MGGRSRVYDLARELGLTNKELLELLAAQGLEVKSHASSIDEEYAELMREHVISRRRAAAAVPASAVSTPTPSRPAPTPPVGVDAAAQAEIHLKPPVIVRDLAEALGRKPNELIGELMTMNVFAAINQVVEVDIVEKICVRHGYRFIPDRREKKTKARPPVSDKAMDESVERKVPRAPVVAVLGHVDHGKTSLLDAIRKTNVAAGELGGITQHIGASVIQWRSKYITFLDTPGHEAFTGMRARGANATDLVVLVVAADDGVMPQTLESMDHARAANVPMIIAINKVDLPSARPDQVMVALQQHGLNPEEWGGDVGMVKVSARTGQGIDGLLERILLEAEVMELRGNPELPCRGLVIEAQLESGMGPTANVLVRNGSLHVGDVVLCGHHWGRVKALLDHQGKRVQSGGPSTPVKVLGLSGVPLAGDSLTVCADERDAKRTAEERAMSARAGQLALTRHANLDDLFRQMEEEARNELKLIVKADVRGSIEAILESLKKLQSDKISLNVIHSGVGEITENDVLLGAASDAIVVGFHVRAMPGVNKVAKREGVEIRLYGIIYDLVNEIRDAMRGRLEPERREVVLGSAEILQIFQTTKAGKICGCMVKSGVIRSGAMARVRRDGELIYTGQVQSLRRFQDDAKEVRDGLECGIRLDNFEDFEVGDQIEVSTIEEVAAEL